MAHKKKEKKETHSRKTFHPLDASLYVSAGGWNGVGDCKKGLAQQGRTALEMPLHQRHQHLPWGINNQHQKRRSGQRGAQPPSRQPRR